MRIFLGLTEVSGFFSRLKLGLDELGIPCEYVTLQQHRFAYDGSPPPKVGQRIVEACMAGRLRARDRGTRLRYFA